MDYALRRGNSKDPWGPPQAFEEIYPYPNKDPQNQPNAPWPQLKSGHSNPLTGCSL
ncbi:hypothetical protein M5E89_09810 [Acidaminococcus intestini]|nr:hypothetical protein M5E89_09810 [Acidaminococcus intestini]